MRELSVTEQRFKAVLAEISDGRTVTSVARDWDVSRQTLHGLLGRSGGIAASRAAARARAAGKDDGVLNFPASNRRNDRRVRSNIFGRQLWRRGERRSSSAFETARQRQRFLNSARCA